jgi:hypothetical protein
VQIKSIPWINFTISSQSTKKRATAIARIIDLDFRGSATEHHTRKLSSSTQKSRFITMGLLSIWFLLGIPS